VQVVPPGNEFRKSFRLFDPLVQLGHMDPREEQEFAVRYQERMYRDGIVKDHNTCLVEFRWQATPAGLGLEGPGPP
jgi:hypothetical protein